MPSINLLKARSQEDVSKEIIAKDASSVTRRRRQFLMATVLTTGLFATLGLSTEQAKAANECGAVGAGNFSIACGQGPYTSIVYGNAETAPATSTVFTFTSTQAVGGGLGDSRQAVFLSSGNAGESITVNIAQTTIQPSFVATGSAISGNGSAFIVQTSGGVAGNGAPIDFTVDTGVFTGATAGLGNSHGLLLSTTGADSGITSKITVGGSYSGGTGGLGSAHGFVQTTTGGNSGIDSTIAGGTFTGGSAGTGNAHGLLLSTGGATSAVSLTMTGGTAQGGSALLGNAHGLAIATTGVDSGVTAHVSGSFTGGNAILGAAYGIGISTTGSNSSVDFALNGGSANGGTSPLSSADGVRIVTGGTGSNITFEQAAGTTITGTNGNGVTLHANGGGNIDANNTINGTVNGGLTIAGVGLGAGFVGTAVGAGTVGIHVGTTGIVNGTGSGLIGTAVNGNVTLSNDGQVNQTALVASSLNPFDPGYSVPFAALPVGMGGAATGTGNVDITTSVGSSVNQAGAQALTGIEGVGIVATTVLGSGNSTITAAGAVNATGIGLWSNANSGTAIATANGAVNVTGGAGGNTLFIDPYLIQSQSTVGVLAQSITGAATANLLSANGNAASVGGTNAPDIGLAATVFAGSQNATVNVNGTDGGATVNANVTGLYAAVSILGTGSAIINQTNGSTTAPVAAAAVALNPASNAIITNTDNSSLNGAVIAAAGQDATVTNQFNSQINIPALSAQVIVAGRDATVNNTTGSSITFAGPLSFNVMVAGQDATINNVNSGTSFTVNGPLSANLMFANRDATINNYNGAQFNLNGPFAASAMVAGRDAIINNYNGADFNMTGAVDANLMVAQRDAIIENYNGATFNMAGVFNANMMFAQQDAIIRNYNGGDFNVIGAINLNYMNAERDAKIENFNGGTFNLIGALNGNVMVADRDASITNYNGGDFNVLGVLNGSLMIAGQDASITNYNGGTFNLIGGGNGSVMVAGRDAFITNYNGAQFNMAGFNGNIMVATRDAIIDNFNGASINMNGFNEIAMVAGRDASITNRDGASINLNGVNNIVIDGVNSSTFNNSSNFGGNNNADCSANGLAGICVTGIARIAGGALGGPLEFNNAGGLLSMINGNATRFSDNTGIIAPGYNTQIGDITYIGDPFLGRVANFNGTGNSQLGFDAVLRGPNNSASDVVVITGATSGKTGMIINDLAGGPGSLNLTGIPLIAVTSGQTNKGEFFIDPTSQNYSSKFGGVIDKGLFIYSHQLRDDPYFAGGKDHVLIATPDQELFEYGKAVTGAQNIWYESTGVWLERQADLRNFLMARGGGMPAGAGADMPVKAVYKAAPPPDKSITPGVWIKGLASWTDRDATDSFSIPGQTFTYDTSYKQKVFGVMGGVDGGWDYKSSVFMVGLLGGYLDSNLKFNSSGNSIDYSGGTVGAYATYLNGAFYIDTIFKADLLKMKWNANTLAGFGFATPEADANSYGIQADMGYRMQYGAAFFEPLGTIAWLRTKIDDVNVLGQNLHFGDTDSVRGSLGARVGVANYWSGMKVEASITGRVWHEFEDPAALVLNQGLLTINDAFKGTYGDVNGTLNFIGLRSGWSSFLNGGVKWNSDFTTVSAKGGVRYNW